MKQIMVTLQGERFCPDIGPIEKLPAENPGWGRSREAGFSASDVR